MSTMWKLERGHEERHIRQNRAPRDDSRIRQMQGLSLGLCIQTECVVCGNAVHGRICGNCGHCHSCG